jgi:hypothetical protein
MYYILTYELKKPKFDASITGILQNEKKEIIPSSFGFGKALKTNEKYVIAVDPEWSQSGKKRDMLKVKAHKDDLFVVNEKVKLFLEKYAPLDVEFRHVTFEYLDNTEKNTDYFIVNVLSKINCLDYENSELDFEDYDEEDNGWGDIYTIDSLTIDPNRVPTSKHIFLLDRRQDAIIIVSEKLKTEIEKKSFTGFKFCEPENFAI